MYKSRLTNWSEFNLTFKLLNAGGEPSCRCYTSAFRNNGFIQDKPLNCKDENSNEGNMIFFNPSNRRYQTRSITSKIRTINGAFGN